ncbi:MAG TPA: diacylglyceryl transferase, partial [Bacteroidetes bacterium]|nr:diacylglyceryl transferase [Bacteroidota bacterium]
PCVLFSIYLIFSGTERFFIEHIRVDNTYNIFGHYITQAEIISPILVFIGLVGWYVLEKRAKTEKAI